jgi:alpha,alpha-trehalose phosphorylase
VNGRPAPSVAIDRERYPIDEWALIETRPSDSIGLTGTLFVIGNGYLGMRADHDPDPQSSGTFVNGFHESFRIEYPEQAFALARAGQALVNAPDTKSIELRVDGEVLRLDPGRDDAASIAGYSRTIDFRTGVARTEFTWNSTANGRVHIVSERFVSLARRHVAALRLTVTPRDDGATVVVTSKIVNRQDVPVERAGGNRTDPRRGRSFDRRVLNPELAEHTEQALPGGGDVVLGFRAAESAMAIAAGYRHAASVACTTETALADDEAATTLTFDAVAGQAIVLDKFVAYHTSAQLPDDDDFGTLPAVLGDRCRGSLADAAAAGWDLLVAEQGAWLDDFWERTDVEIDGDPAAQQAVRWNLFQLAQASAETGERGIAAKAVTAGGYDGHYFWDTEVYVLPLLAYTTPAAARDLIRFRHRTLPAARQRAIEMTQRGALYPWRTINGHEASAYYPAGTAQYHIDAAVSYALERYAVATGDDELLDEAGVEIMIELARLFADLGHYDSADPPQFHIHAVTGPDEYTTVVDDNLYTNVMARFTLRVAATWVAELAARNPAGHAAVVSRTALAPNEPGAWLRAAEAMCVLYDAELGINPQDDAFLGHPHWDWAGTPESKYPLLINFHPLVIYRHQVLKQADVVQTMFMRGEEFELDLQRRNFDYYDPLTTGDSSLSACVQAIAAAQIGYHDVARHYFDQSLYLDLADTHGNTIDGTHIANVGGVWAALVHGFAGVRDLGHQLRVAPRLPDGWKSMRFRLQRRGAQLEFSVDADGATVSITGGDPVTVVLGDGTAKELRPGAPVRVPPATF